MVNFHRHGCSAESLAAEVLTCLLDPWAGREWIEPGL